MRIAILSDIHGNAIALEAVLRDLERQGIDEIIIPGDLFAFGPAPNDVFSMLQQLPKARYLIGNTDRYLIQASYPTSPGGDGWQDRLLLSFKWTAERLKSEAFQFLNTLPTTQTLRHHNWLLLAVHGSPRSDEEGLTIKTEAETLDEMSIDPQVNMLVCGHTHVPMERLVAGMRVVNAGSVGLSFDGDPRACYAIISSVPVNGHHSTHVRLKRVAYDIEKAVEQFYALNHPAADISAFNLRTGRSMGSSLIYTPKMRYSGRTAAIPALQPA